jgi:prophage tail gpP-like protein
MSLVDPAIYASLGQDIAVLKARGMEFQDWESVYVQIRWNDSFDYCRFTATERREDVQPYTGTPLIQFKPCDDIEVWLSGQLAMTGVLTERQVAYDSDNHGVQLLGKGMTMWGYKSSVNSETGSWDNMPFEAIARQLLEPYGKVKVVGKLNPLPFVHVQNHPGEPIWTFLENLARPRGIILASDKDGSYLLIGERTTSPDGSLVEGVNIKSFNMTVNIDDQFLIYRAIGQVQGSDSSSGTAANEQQSSPIKGTSCKASYLLVPAEQPVTKGELDDRNKNEAKWHEAARIYVTIVVQGWTSDGVHLWQVGSSVWVKSPMGPIDMPMSIQRATFTQDRNGGSQTTLDLVLPWMLNDSQVVGLREYTAPTAADPATLAQIPFA